MTTTTTKHLADCRRVFANYDPRCPRCSELAGGAPARSGWGDRKRIEDERRRRWIRAHDCTRSNCGPVCTAFDW